MKKDIHPNYREVVFQDASADFRFITRSTIDSKETIEIDGKTYPLVPVEISSESHPFFTGKMKFVDTAGRVEKFQSKFAKTMQDNKKKKAQAEVDRKAEIERKAEEKEAARQAKAEAKAKEEEKKAKAKAAADRKAAKEKEKLEAAQAAKAAAEGDAVASSSLSVSDQSETDPANVHSDEPTASGSEAGADETTSTSEDVKAESAETDSAE